MCFLQADWIIQRQSRQIHLGAKILHLLDITDKSMIRKQWNVFVYIIWTFFLLNLMILVTNQSNGGGFHQCWFEASMYS